jgi:ParB family transcriptional regulator, chromosome partitioning protein
VGRVVSDFASVLRIDPHPSNVRDDLGDLADLAESIRSQGILQPIIVQPNPRKHGCYVVLGGHRRLAAAKLAGLDEVPIVVREAAGAAKAIEVMLVENCQRADLNPMDKAEAIGQLRKHGYSQTAIGRAIGLSGATVSYYLSLLELDGPSRERVRASEVSAAMAIAAVRGTRKRRRKKSGAAPMGARWEPDYLNATHPLARKADAMCRAREHTMRRRIGKVACGQCWETVIRQDEQLAQRVAGNGHDTSNPAVPVPFKTTGAVA